MPKIFGNRRQCIGLGKLYNHTQCWRNVWLVWWIYLPVLWRFFFFFISLEYVFKHSPPLSCSGISLCIIHPLWISFLHAPVTEPPFLDRHSSAWTYLFTSSICVECAHAPQHTCGVQKLIWRSRYFSSIICFLGLELTLLDMASNIFTHWTISPVHNHLFFT